MKQGLGQVEVVANGIVLNDDDEDDEEGDDDDDDYDDDEDGTCMRMGVRTMIVIAHILLLNIYFEILLLR